MRQRIGRDAQPLLRALAFLLLACALSACAGNETKRKNKIKDAEFHFKMGAGYFQSHEIPLAIRELTRAIELDKDSHKAHYLLAFIYMGRREYNKAGRHLKRTLELKPKFHPAKNNLGTVYLSTGRWRDAIRLYQELLDEPLYTTPELAHNNIGWAYYQLRRYNDASRHLRLAIFLKPQLCLGYNNLGLVHRASGKWSEAEKHFRKAIERCPDNYAEPHFNLGKILQERGIAAARGHFRRCIELQPHSNLGERCKQYLQ